MDMKVISHYCDAWDFLWVSPGDPEMECCTCQDYYLRLSKDYTDIIDPFEKFRK